MVLKRVKSQSGFTLVEVLVVVALIGIIAAMSSIGFDIVYGHQLTAAKGQLLTDLKKLRVDAVTRSPDLATRGFGVRFLSGSSYRIFEFRDLDGSFDYKADHTEAVASGIDTTLPSSITVTIGNAGAAADNIRIYDNRGILRQANWSSSANQTYVIRHAKVAQAKCIVIDTVLIREGNWNGAACN